MRRFHGAAGRSRRCSSAEVGLQFRHIRYPTRRKRDALQARNPLDPAGAAVRRVGPAVGTARLPRARRSGRTPASSLPSSSCLSDLHLRNDVVRIKLRWFNVVTATFTRHISSWRAMLEFKIRPEAACDFWSPRLVAAFPHGTPGPGQKGKLRSPVRICRWKAGELR